MSFQLMMRLTHSENDDAILFKNKIFFYKNTHYIKKTYFKKLKRKCLYIANIGEQPLIALTRLSPLHNNKLVCITQ